MEKKPLPPSPNIDDSSRAQTVRQTLQPKQSEPKAETRPRSQSYSYKTAIVIEPPIPEEEDEVNIGQNGTRMSFTKKPPSRSNSTAGVKAKIMEVKGYDNGGFEIVGGVNHGFTRGYIDSNRSSAHGSVQSLHSRVQREQYCCFSRWSSFEKRLATSVGILAGVIIGLVIAVGLLARHTEPDVSFMWKP